ncbi:hypothetical protein ADICYQ_3237 [Cyclobacterium qasimii M12-11B]|uniref:Uncharacterized protein n=1 Tax=Cyclobacterium qasimii M12-11B TaxID=641524 RepID=S7VCW1_9BACT|nr:hypothetical protein ADICYQ_3237 [Cyclobacterium qasimii M12-11B]
MPENIEFSGTFFLFIVILFSFSKKQLNHVAEGYFKRVKPTYQSLARRSQYLVT